MIKVINKYSMTAIVMVVAFANCMHAQSISCGGYHSHFVCANGTAQAVGKNEFGQLGDGPGVSTPGFPSPVVLLSGVTAVGGGGDHCLFLKDDGTAWSVGYNVSGALGNGTSGTISDMPVQVAGLNGIIAIAGGGYHSVFLKNDGTVWTVGNNVSGQLGDGTTVNKSIAVQVVGLSGIVAIAAGLNHSIFVKNDGTVWAAGNNYGGQLGDGTYTSRSTPVQVLGLTQIISASCGQQHSVFLKSDGTAWSVGSNVSGQLGDGSNVLHKTTPVQVSGLTNITAIAAGYDLTYFLKNDGTLSSVGMNMYGSLGDGTTGNIRTTPVDVVGLTDIIGVAAGNLHALFLKNDATVWSVGNNNNGQLGDGGASPFRSTAGPVVNLCTALETEENFLQNSISVSPNPFKEQLVIKLDDFQNTTAEIFDLQGQLLEQIAVRTSSTPVQTNHLANGIYLLQIKSTKKLTVKKIVKN